MSFNDILGHGEVLDRRLRLLLVVVLLATVVGGAVDLAFDAPESVFSAHVLFEVLLILAAMATFVMLWRGWWTTRRSLESALAGFGHAIEEKFDAWQLTPVERQIALLLLKGHSHKQIAFDTGRSERTVRQHAVDVYQKSGLRGRAEFAAFFLEGLSLPFNATEKPRSEAPPGSS